ncbi:hypothetical protein Nepgr_015409 [Nepenthes gracilis]|uniref:Uncharacterized protein n=1 Tax=Nepenthes gracilis TaxID=150966 RepID=A0AAD3SLM3_NEPGR|nr:hypothetical protein Nepgr_015409 [Nepenthes gracilis]
MEGGQKKREEGTAAGKCSNPKISPDTIGNIAKYIVSEVCPQDMWPHSSFSSTGLNTNVAAKSLNPPDGFQPTTACHEAFPCQPEAEPSLRAC